MDVLASMISWLMQVGCWADEFTCECASCRLTELFEDTGNGVTGHVQLIMMGAQHALAALAISLSFFEIARSLSVQEMGTGSTLPRPRQQRKHLRAGGNRDSVRRH